MGKKESYTSSKERISSTISFHSIAPKRVIRGKSAWDEGKKIVPFISRNPIFIGRSKQTLPLRKNIFSTLKREGVQATFTELEYDCCETDLKRLKTIALRESSDGVFAVGGGKVLDAGKLLAHQLKIPCITMPLSAATCAGWTALSNVYSEKGSFRYDQVLDHCPELLIFDHDFVRKAPPRTLASGIADALAKWYEASVSSGSSTDGLVQQALQMARVLRDQLLLDGQLAFSDKDSEAWVRVAEGCALTAGLIGGIGGARCRTVAAHAVHNGLTQIEDCQSLLHGEKVAYGVLVQLRLEETIYGNKLAEQSRKQLLTFLQKLSLPTRLEDLGLTSAMLPELQKVCNFACQENSEIHHLPFSVNRHELLEAFICASKDTDLISHSTEINVKSI